MIQKTGLKTTPVKESWKRDQTYTVEGIPTFLHPVIMNSSLARIHTVFVDSAILLTIVSLLMVTYLLTKLPYVKHCVKAAKPWKRKRFAVPQEITGWWQINDRIGKPIHLNTDEDLYYIYNYSIWLDILILPRTPFAVLQGRGAS